MSLRFGAIHTGNLVFTPVASPIAIPIIVEVTNHG